MNSWIKRKFSFLFLICTILMCIFFALPGEFLCRLAGEGKSILFVGIYFALFGVMLLVGLYIAAFLEKQEMELKGLGIGAACIILLFLSGMLFEFLYELGGEKTQTAADNKYVFLIDNSGSMEGNDPSQERVAAVRRILEDQPKDAQYAVYSFGENVGCVRRMGPVSEGSGGLETEPAGGTPIVAMLQYLKQEFENGILIEPEATRVILLTDGYATDNGLFGGRINRTLKYFNKNHITISTVGLGDADERLLKKIADRTGGISIMVSDVDQLKGAMQSAIVREDNSRNLLSYRENVSMTWLYVLMRILFVAILGLIVMVIKLAVVNNVESQGIILAVSVVGSLLAGIVLEAGINAVGAPEPLMRLIAAVLMGITPAYVIKAGTSRSYVSYDEESGFDDYGGYGGSGGMRID